jgi:hypothetical protein
MAEMRVMVVAVMMLVMTGGLPNGKAAWSRKTLMITVSITCHHLLQIARRASCWGNIWQHTTVTECRLLRRRGWVVKSSATWHCVCDCY